jgi:hypothetical protein
VALPALSAKKEQIKGLLDKYQPDQINDFLFETVFALRDETDAAN